MRRVLVVGLMGLFVPPLAAIVGCGDGAKATLPAKTYQLPPSPVAAGAPAPGQEDTAQKAKQAAD